MFPCVKGYSRINSMKSVWKGRACSGDDRRSITLKWRMEEEWEMKKKNRLVISTFLSVWASSASLYSHIRRNVYNRSVFGHSTILIVMNVSQDLLYLYTSEFHGTSSKLLAKTLIIPTYTSTSKINDDDSILQCLLTVRCPQPTHKKAWIRSIWVWILLQKERDIERDWERERECRLPTQHSTITPAQKHYISLLIHN